MCLKRAQLTLKDSRSCVRVVNFEFSIFKVAKNGEVYFPMQVIQLCVCPCAKFLLNENCLPRRRLAQYDVLLCLLNRKRGLYKEIICL